MWVESERAGEWAKRMSERGYCRIIPVARAIARVTGIIRNILNYYCGNYSFSISLPPQLPLSLCQRVAIWYKKWRKTHQNWRCCGEAIWVQWLKNTVEETLAEASIRKISQTDKIHSSKLYGKQKILVLSFVFFYWKLIINSVRPVFKTST